MSELRNKINAISMLLSQGIIDNDEYKNIVSILSSENKTDNITLSFEEKKYNEHMEKVKSKLKAPTTMSFPKFDLSMIKNIDKFWGGTYKVIETYVDSQNSYGANIRTPIRIKIDNDFNYLGTSFFNMNAWSFYQK